MFISLDFERDTPIFAQIVEGIRLAIASGRIELGDKVPSIRELAVCLRVNPNTVAKAYQELERRGILEVRRGMGTFVSPKQIKPNNNSATDLLKAQIDQLISTGLAVGFTIEDMREIFEKRMASRTSSWLAGKTSE